MKKKIMAFLTLSAIAATFTLGACNGTPEWEIRKFYNVMNTGASLIIFKDGKDGNKRFEELCNQTEGVLRDLDNSLSVTAETSSIYKFNVASAGEYVEIDKTAYEVLTVAKTVYQTTDGYYNPAVYYNVQAFGFDGGNYPKTADGLPKDEDIAKYNELSARFEEVELKEQDGKYYAVKPDFTVNTDGKTYSMKIDLGGIGKGYAVDKVDALIESYGFKYGYFDFGSSSLSFKAFNKSRGWDLQPVNARDQLKKGAYAKVTVSNTCVSTSGDYEQFYTIDGTRYCHVCNPATGKPVQTGIMTATVIGGTATENDALTTALMAMGKENAVKFINEKLPDRQVIMSLELSAGKYAIITNIPADKFTVLSDNFTVLNALKDGKIVLGE